MVFDHRSDGDHRSGFYHWGENWAGHNPSAVLIVILSYNGLINRNMFIHESVSSCTFLETHGACSRQNMMLIVLQGSHWIYYSWWYHNMVWLPVWLTQITDPDPDQKGWKIIGIVPLSSLGEIFEETVRKRKPHPSLTGWADVFRQKVKITKYTLSLVTCT